jgi:hypothetical protein
MKRRIAILVLKEQRKVDRPYMIHDYSAFWREAGHDVVTLYGVDEFVPADALIVHVDLSVVPDEYLEFASRYPVVLNGRVKDIRKRAISRHLVTRGDSYRGPVIVKSDLNFAGASEIGLKRHNFKAWPFKRPTDYQVMPSRSRRRHSIRDHRRRTRGRGCL